ncbi:hypothetical protein [Clostridium tyrobutyricum]|uniref:hypothetical protein n=1 Tax=Clostridium tyrobutyricum TaxID=1519 RepID=UPI0030D4A4C9
MSKEKLIYNYSGMKYWEKLYQKQYERLCLYEGYNGKYVGEIINDMIYDSRTGEYLGEIYEGRLIVNKSKVDKEKIKGNFMFRASNRTGHRCVKNVPEIEIPKGYEDFTAGIE